jgi:fused signal recognition particle receptor
MLDWLKSRTTRKPSPEESPGRDSAPPAALPGTGPLDAPAGPAADSAPPGALPGAAGIPADRHEAPRLDPWAPAAPPTPQPSWRDRLRAGLAKTRHAVGLTKLFAKLDEASLDELESSLLMADAGLPATSALLDDLRARWKRQGGEHGAEPARTLLKLALTDLLRPLESPLRIDARRPFVIMLVGVNGAGKTTSIGKLAKWLQSQNLSVLLAAGDTFRAAAREQLQAWGQRNNVTVVTQEGGDPAAVIFDAVQAARRRGVDVVLADTAGRLPTQIHLMDELKKIKRVISKAEPGAPHEVLLVLDGNTGQNALSQLQAFDAALGVTGLVLTKLDGTAKGGVVAAIAKSRPVPLRFIGIGEAIDDLRPFAAAEFASALLDE